MVRRSPRLRQQSRKGRNVEPPSSSSSEADEEQTRNRQRRRSKRTSRQPAGSRRNGRKTKDKDLFHSPEAHKSKKDSLVCPLLCQKLMKSAAAYRYHVKHKVCERRSDEAEKAAPMPGEESLICPLFCGKEMNSVYAYRYHVKNEVCERKREREVEAKRLMDERKKAKEAMRQKRIQKRLQVKAAKRNKKKVRKVRLLEASTSAENPLSPASLPQQSLKPNVTSATEFVFEPLTQAQRKSSEWGFSEQDMINRRPIPDQNDDYGNLIEITNDHFVYERMYDQDGLVKDSGVLKKWILQDTPEESNVSLDSLFHGAKVLKLRMRRQETFHHRMLSWEQPRPYGQSNEPVKTVPVLTAVKQSEPGQQPDFLLNCAKPIYALEFAPRRQDSNLSFLAVGTAASKDIVNVLGEVRNETVTNCIQLWALNEDDCTLLYTVNISPGSVLSLSWCKSRSAQSSKLLGLLAYSNSCGKIEILQMPWIKSSDNTTVYDASKLCVFDVQSICCSTTCVEWCRGGNGTTLFAGRSDGTVSCWKMEDCSPGANNLQPCLTLGQISADLVHDQMGSTFIGGRIGVLGIASNSKSPQLVAVLHVSGFVKIWDLRSPFVPVFSQYVTTPIRLTSISWPPGADYLLVGDESGALRFIQLDDGSCRQVKIHCGSIYSVKTNPRFTPPCSLSCSCDGTVMLWSFPPAVCHSVDEGEVSPRSSILVDWRKRRRRKGNAIIQARPVEVLQVDMEDERRVNPAAKKTPHSEVILFAGNKVEFPGVNGAALRDSDHTIPKYGEPPEKIHPSTVVWGESSVAMNDWIGWGTKGNLVRLRRVEFPH